MVSQVAVTQAMLPMLRAARGRIAFMSSIGGRMSTPMLGPYSASKHALEAIGDALRQELRPFGVEVALIEPGSIATPFWGKGQDEADRLLASVDPELHDLYRGQIETVEAAAVEAEERGVAPERVAEAVVHALTAERPRTRYLVGTDARIQAALRVALPNRVLDRLVARELGRSATRHREPR